MKTYDVVIVGGGLIGCSLALELRRDGAAVAIVEKGEAGREASWAAAGMLAHCDPHTAPALVPLAAAAARRYPQFVHELEDESGVRVDFRRDGSILFVKPEEKPVNEGWRPLSAEELTALEPGISTAFENAFYVPESSVDARALSTAAVATARHRGVEFVSGQAAEELIVEDGRAAGARTARTEVRGKLVVNCCGAWAGELKTPIGIPVKPIRGQVVSVVTLNANPAAPLLRHTVRQSGVVYLAPRSDGRVLVGSTMEDVGFDKRVVPETIQGLLQTAANLVPEIGEARMLESWAGLRPGSPDGLPLMGATPIEGYFTSTGHFRDGILLAPISAALVADAVRGRKPEFDLTPFSPTRF